MYSVYLLECADGSIYTGITTDLARRLDEHRNKTASKYTRARGATSMLYAESHETRSAALKREAEIKSWRRDKKLELIRQKR
jgi:putative endonuclease